MKLWKGRFTKSANQTTDEFGASITFDKRLYKEDIAGSIAHAKMLAKQGILTQEEAESICSALLEIRDEIEAGNVEFDIASEDIHMNIETLLTEKIGDAGKRLHTARSRNDQVAVDFKVYVMGESEEIDGLLEDLTGTLHDLAEKIFI